MAARSAVARASTAVRVLQEQSFVMSLYALDGIDAPPVPPPPGSPGSAPDSDTARVNGSARAFAAADGPTRAPTAVLSAGVQPVLQAEFHWRAVAPARWLRRIVGERASDIMTRERAPMCAVALGLLTLLLFSLPELANTRMPAPLGFLLFLLWSIVMLLLLRVLDASLVSFVNASFEALYLQANVALFAVLNIAGHAPIESANDLAYAMVSMVIYVGGMLYYVHLDAVVATAYRRRRMQHGLMACLIIGLARNLVVEQLGPPYTTFASPDKLICLVYCAGLRTVAMSAQATTLVFLLKAFFFNRQGQPKLIRTPMWRTLTDKSEWILSTSLTISPGRLPDAVVQSIYTCNSTPPTLVTSRENVATTRVPIATLPRVPFWRAPRVIARVARHRYYQYVPVVFHIIIHIAEAASYTRYPGVAIPLLLYIAVTAVLELTFVDRSLLRVLAKQFEVYYVLGSGIVFAVAGAVASANSPLESFWSQLFRCILAVWGMAWLVLLDASHTSSILVHGRIVVAVSHIVRWFITEAVQPHMDSQEELCVMFCSRVATLALSALANAAAFALKQAYYAFTSDHMLIVTAAPEIVTGDLLETEPGFCNGCPALLGTKEALRDRRAAMAGADARGARGTVVRGSDPIRLGVELSESRDTSGLPAGWVSLRTQGMCPCHLWVWTTDARAVRRRRLRILPPHGDRQDAGLRTSRSARPRCDATFSSALVQWEVPSEVTPPVFSVSASTGAHPPAP
jgi:hypothetical protein